MPGLMPASRVEVFDVVIPASTSRAAAIETPTTWAAGELVSLDVRIPDGVAGLVGFRFLYAHAQAIPTTPGAWIIGNDDTFSVNPVGHLNGGQWSVLAYNLDGFDHSLHVVYHVLDFSYLGGAIAQAPPQTPVLS